MARASSARRRPTRAAGRRESRRLPENPCAGAGIRRPAGERRRRRAVQRRTRPRTALRRIAAAHARARHHRHAADADQRHPPNCAARRSPRSRAALRRRCRRHLPDCMWKVRSSRRRAAASIRAAVTAHRASRSRRAARAVPGTAAADARAGNRAARHDRGALPRAGVVVFARPQRRHLSSRPQRHSQAGVVGFTHLFNAMSQLRLARARHGRRGARQRRGGAGIIVDGPHVHPAAVRLAFAAQGPARLFLVSDAMPTAATAPRPTGSC